MNSAPQVSGAHEWTSAERDKACLALAGFVLIAGLALGLANLRAGPWMDEFNTTVTTLGSHSLAEFFERSLRGQHPLLFEGAVFLAQKLGVSEIEQLRLINLLGVPLVLSGLWISWRAGALSVAQAAIIAAVFASSVNLTFYLVSVRPYFLMWCASLATALAWRLVLRDAPRAKTYWTIALAIFVNVHYFATICGGVLTLALLIDRWRLGRKRDAATLAALSFAAALPALILGALQASYTTGGGVLYYFPSGLDYALLTAGAAIFAAGAGNFALFGFAAHGAWRATRGAQWDADTRDAAGLLAVALVFLLVMTGLHLIKPMLYDRYLIAAAGPIAVGAALLASRPWAQIAAASVCACAVLALIMDVARGPKIFGWELSAEAVQQAVSACPSTRVLTVPYARVTNGPIWTTPLNPTESEARSYGYRYYAERYGFTVTDLKPGDAVSASGPCPTLIWIEHFWPADRMSNVLFYHLNLRVTDVVRYDQIGTGVIVTLFAPPET